MLRFLRLFSFVRELELSLQRERDFSSDLGRQIYAERELRRSAEARAEDHHQETITAYEKSADWLARVMAKPPMYGRGEEGAGAEKGSPAPVPIQGKRFARRVAQEYSSKTLQELTEQLKSGNIAGLDQLRDTPTPVNPAESA